MMAAHLQAVATAPALTRLEAMTQLDEAARLALQSEMQRARVMRRNHSLLSEGMPITRRMLILEGWAARTRVFADGQLQIMSFLLPGDLIGNCTHSNPVSVCSVTALTDVRYCLAPAPRLSSTLAEAYAASRACEEAYLLAQIARLGRLTAEERGRPAARTARTPRALRPCQRGQVCLPADPEHARRRDRTDRGSRQPHDRAAAPPGRP
jgi:CRP-like cAMP-binding protein